MNTFKYRQKYKSSYFEGWYIRLIGKENIAVIFGITTNKDNPHAFIQYTDSRISKYYSFSLNEVKTTNNSVIIGENKLTKNSLILNVLDIKLNIKFLNVKTLKKNFINNSIMSFLYYLPLECYQEVIYLDGEYTQEGDKGRVYIEKTYGKKFPKEWIWIQSNSFPLTLASAKMPLLFNKFGFYCLFEYEKKQYIFASYKLGKIKIMRRGNTVDINIKQGKYRLELSLKLNNTVRLLGSTNNGLMTITVNESLDSNLSVKFTKKNKLIHQSTHKDIAAEVEMKNHS
ncbi:tocopherol cyclase family protein [Mycoplasmatota bacterium zrk1]